MISHYKWGLGTLTPHNVLRAAPATLRRAPYLPRFILPYDKMSDIPAVGSYSPIPSSLLGKRRTGQSHTCRKN